MKYDEIIAYFYESIPNYHKYGAKDFKPGLEKIKELLDAIGNPGKGLNFIHVAGTNGKGSTCNFLAHYLVKSGYKTGLFTSPHLFDFRERILLNGDLIPKKYIIDFFNKNKAIFDRLEPSFFELTFAMALSYYKSENTDICVIETGLGGRLDATNIIQPEIVAITNIGMDHTEFLGDSIEEIAFEKGGIIKKNTPVVFGDITKKAENILIKIAQEKKAKTIHSKSYLIEFLSYQQTNLNLAKTILEELIEMGWRQINLDYSIKELQIEGRFQKIQENPAIIIDVAHNQDGFQTLFAQKEILEASKLHILFSGTKEKNLSEILSFFPVNAEVHFTSFSNKRSLEQADFTKQNKVKVYTYHKNPIEAFKAIKAQLSATDTFLICGSFYLISDLKPLLNSKS